MHAIIIIPIFKSFAALKNLANLAEDTTIFDLLVSLYRFIVFLRLCQISKVWVGLCFKMSNLPMKMSVCSCQHQKYARPVTYLAPYVHQTNIWMLHMPKRLTPYAKRVVEVEKNDKILYIALKFLIKKYDVDCNIASAFFIRNICFEYGK